MFCSVLCRDRSRLRRKTYTPRPVVREAKACARCGKQFLARKGTKFCGVRCSNATARERWRRRQGLPVDRQERVCQVCGATFTTRRAMQVNCSRKCGQFVRNKRLIDKRRKTDAPPRVSPVMIERRAAAIRAGWNQETRFERREAVPLAPGDPDDDE